ncbi:Scr1 family TA system antitoxin-like transcriptional regulator [Actinoallomurus sp. NBC_01490]|uniref:Scr1 family TA system antitoxin-like transcriptional regulator n=1 Tax=Actinoallomurus sp. NBC_01490 TaxID=2903557 RepID=UPI003FA46CA2
MERADPPTLWSLLDEGAIDRSANDPEVMRKQLARLLEEATSLISQSERGPDRPVSMLVRRLVQDLLPRAG